MKNSQKQEWARLLYIAGELTQKEIAEKVSITEKTMSTWVNRLKWDEIKASVTVSKDETLKRLYIQINEITAAIQKKPEGERYASGKEADSLSKLSATIRNLETEVSLSETIEVFKRFTNWLRPIDLDKAKEIIHLHDSYIKSIMK
jgi:hypothetical protein